MNGRTVKRLRRALFNEMVASGTIVHSSYEIATTRRKDGEQAQMLVCTGFRKIYQEMKRDLKVDRRGQILGTPDRSEAARTRKRKARARARIEYRRRAAEILAAREARA